MNSLFGQNVNMYIPSKWTNWSPSSTISAPIGLPPFETSPPHLQVEHPPNNFTKPQNSENWVEPLDKEPT